MRDVAYWNKSFLDEVESDQPDEGGVLWALGGPSFVYRSPQTTIWIDPYLSGTPDSMAALSHKATPIPINPDEIRLGDIIISTHAHIDHCHGGTLLPVLEHTTAFCVGPESSVKKMQSFGIPDERIRQVSPGDTLTFRDVQLYVYPGYDANEPSAVTFVLASGGTKLFISGDTADGPALAEIGSRHSLDYALLAFGRTWYMNETEMLRVARKLNPRVLLPFHWEFWRNHTGNIAKLFEVYYRDRPNFDIRILLIGDAIRLKQGQA